MGSSDVPKSGDRHPGRDRARSSAGQRSSDGRDGHQKPADALELLAEQDRALADLFAKWRAQTDELRQGDSVETRWERGSAVKLILQHLAVREETKQTLAEALDAAGHADLAARVDGDGTGRRMAIARLEEEIRGKLGINTNEPAADRAVAELGERLDRELPAEQGGLLDEVAAALGPEGRQELPSPRWLMAHSPTHPNPEPRWYDRIGPLKALRALYDHLRGEPSGARAPGLEGAREETPGVHS